MKQYREDRPMMPPCEMVCYHCGRGIRGAVTRINPPRFLKDFPKAYHPDCYRRGEQVALRELRVASSSTPGQTQKEG